MLINHIILLLYNITCLCYFSQLYTFFHFLDMLIGSLLPVLTINVTMYIFQSYGETFMENENSWRLKE
ncbi:hypothetical protein L2E82_28398 [Cichorium intybus]|uniref:Uncharacterized protein n=1 Tax=Cichorium intybus TaxID=13427 RepID=A0ACB9CVN1_CICIN|nr:hypothetical protein L2E82_28398 [Cichorium intybus]